MLPGFQYLWKNLEGKKSPCPSKYISNCNKSIIILFFKAIWALHHSVLIISNVYSLCNNLKVLEDRGYLLASICSHYLRILFSLFSHKGQNMRTNQLDERTKKKLNTEQKKRKIKFQELDYSVCKTCMVPPSQPKITFFCYCTY